MYGRLCIPLYVYTGRVQTRRYISEARWRDTGGMDESPELPLDITEYENACVNCGFLSLRRMEDGQLIEAGDAYRRSGVWPVLDAVSLRPICFTMEANLAIDIGDELMSMNPAKYGTGGKINFEGFAQAQTIESAQARTALDNVLRRDRTDECEWIRWQQGFTPKEHREMLDRKQLMEREDRRDTEQRDWQERQEQRSERLADKRHTRELWIIGGLVTVIVVLATLLGAAIEADWIPDPPWVAN